MGPNWEFDQDSYTNPKRERGESRRIPCRRFGLV
jgi:hypothetical protein